MSKENVLITGGAGYIGSHTAVELSAAGYGVIIVDDLSNSDVATVEAVRRITGAEIPFERIDACDIGALGTVFEKYGFGSVIHFAARKSVGESVREPLEYYDNNLRSFINVLELMRRTGRRNIILSSSAAVYGPGSELPVTESTPRAAAISPYGNTKRICEDILRDSASAYDIRGIALRYFNPAGAHPSALIGESPAGIPNNLVPYITQTAAGVRERLDIYGGDYDTPDGTGLRDYIDITDLARAHAAALERLLSGRNKDDYEIFNVGTGKPTSVLELVKLFEQVNGVKVDYRITDRREGDIPALWADPSLANRELGWRAERSLEDTLRTAWEWEKRARGL